MKTAIKCIAWLVAMLAVSLAIVYGMWLVLIFWLFGEIFFMALTIGGQLLLIAFWILLVRIAEC